MEEEKRTELMMSQKKQKAKTKAVKKPAA